MTLFCQYCPKRQAEFVKILVNGDISLICGMCEAAKRKLPLNKYEREYLESHRSPQETEVYTGPFPLQILEQTERGVLN